METKQLFNLFSREELRRLEKAAKDKNKEKIKEWAVQFEDQLRNYYESESKKVKEFYEKEYQHILSYTVNNFLIAMVYTLHFKGTKNLLQGVSICKQII